VLSACYTAAADTPGDFCLDTLVRDTNPEKTDLGICPGALMLDVDVI